MKKFEYLQVEYSDYPTAKELNEEGVEGWELIEIHQKERKNFYCEEQTSYTQKIYLVTFKREILCQE